MARVFNTVMTLRPRLDKCHSETASEALSEILRQHPEYKSLPARMTLEEREDGTARLEITIGSPFIITRGQIIDGLIVLMLIMTFLYLIR